MYASLHGYSIVVSLLLRKKKADVNVKNNVSQTFGIPACALTYKDRNVVSLLFFILFLHFDILLIFTLRIIMRIHVILEGQHCTRLRQCVKSASQRHRKATSKSGRKSCEDVMVSHHTIQSHQTFCRQYVSLEVKVLYPLYLCLTLSHSVAVSLIFSLYCIWFENKISSRTFTNECRASIAIILVSFLIALFADCIIAVCDFRSVEPPPAIRQVDDS